MPNSSPAARFTPDRKAYKTFIDRKFVDGHGCDYRLYNFTSPDRLKPLKGAAKKAKAANSRRRKGLGAPGKNADPAKGAPRPIVLERRKNRELPADADDQLRQFQSLAHHLLELRQSEQQTISRELHDNIAQVLSAVTARLTLAEHEPIPAWLHQELHDLRDHIQGALADVRSLARELRPSLGDHNGFLGALEKHARAFRERTRIELELRLVPEAIHFLDRGELTHLFRLAQEALQNIEDHSGAQKAWVKICQNDGALHLEIGDDGCSFTPARVIEAQQDGHLGLLGMRERAELLGGEFRLEAAPDEGTVIRVTITQPGEKGRTKHSGDHDYLI